MHKSVFNQHKNLDFTPIKGLILALQQNTAKGKMCSCASKQPAHCFCFLLCAMNNASTQFASHKDTIAANKYQLKKRLCAPLSPWAQQLTDREKVAEVRLKCSH